ncbi:hypothetical protein RCH09_000595 [Actimicrobium sp. GrIS 1.19]|uniref:Dabb family protein n=1 Tax=Actimicrobium sp. GrIS 1.19 TaxID=3071708 RepID=UPI002DF8C751|nr:hypothetical protein [Actimicrobium sp. GrIS 1.19]
MFVHSVYFWLTQEATPQQRAGCQAALLGLLDIPSIRQGHVGQPAATDEPVVDRSFSFGLTLLFDDQAAHDAYQIDPSHLAFVARFGALFARVQVYDTN